MGAAALGAAVAAELFVARLVRVAAAGAASSVGAGAASTLARVRAVLALVGAASVDPATAAVPAAFFRAGVFLADASVVVTLRGAAAATARVGLDSTSTVIPCSSKARTTGLRRRAETPAVSSAVRRSPPEMLPRVAPRARSCCRAGWENSVGSGADGLAGPEDTCDTGTDYLSQYTQTSA